MIKKGSNNKKKIFLLCFLLAFLSNYAFALQVIGFSESNNESILINANETNLNYTFNIPLKNTSPMNFTITNKTCVYLKQEDNTCSLRECKCVQTPIICSKLKTSYWNTNYPSCTNINLDFKDFYYKNIAFNARVISNPTKDGTIPEYLVDGDYNTFWRGESKYAWFVIDLGRPQEFEAIDFEFTHERVDFNLYYSLDDITYEKLVSRFKDEGYQHFEFKPIIARYVLFQAKGEDSWWTDTSIKEFEIWQKQKVDRKGEIITLTLPEEIYTQDFRIINSKCNNNGKEVPYQKIGNNKVIFKFDGESDYSIYYNNKNAEKPLYKTDLSYNPSTRYVENNFYKLRLQDNGESGFDYFSFKKGDNTNIADKWRIMSAQNPDFNKGLKIVENGPLRITFEYDGGYAQKNISFYADSPIIEINHGEGTKKEIYGDWGVPEDEHVSKNFGLQEVNFLIHNTIIMKTEIKDIREQSHDNDYNAASNVLIVKNLTNPFSEYYLLLADSLSVRWKKQYALTYFKDFGNHLWFIPNKNNERVKTTEVYKFKFENPIKATLGSSEQVKYYEVFENCTKKECFAENCSYENKTLFFPSIPCYTLNTDCKIITYKSTTCPENTYCEHSVEKRNCTIKKTICDQKNTRIEKFNPHYVCKEWESIGCEETCSHYSTKKVTRLDCKHWSYPEGNVGGEPLCLEGTTYDEIITYCDDYDNVCRRSCVNYDLAFDTREIEYCSKTRVIEEQGVCSVDVYSYNETVCTQDLNITGYEKSFDFNSSFSINDVNVFNQNYNGTICAGKNDKSVLFFQEFNITYNKSNNNIVLKLIDFNNDVVFLKSLSVHASDLKDFFVMPVSGALNKNSTSMNYYPVSNAKHSSNNSLNALAFPAAIALAYGVFRAGRNERIQTFSNIQARMSKQVADSQNRVFNVQKFARKNNKKEVISTQDFFNTQQQAISASTLAVKQYSELVKKTKENIVFEEKSNAYQDYLATFIEYLKYHKRYYHDFVNSGKKWADDVRREYGSLKKWLITETLNILVLSAKQTIKRVLSAFLNPKPINWKEIDNKYHKKYEDFLNFSFSITGSTSNSIQNLIDFVYYNPGEALDRILLAYKLLQNEETRRSIMKGLQGLPDDELSRKIDSLKLSVNLGQFTNPYLSVADTGVDIVEFLTNFVSWCENVFVYKNFEEADKNFLMFGISGLALFFTLGDVAQAEIKGSKFVENSEEIEIGIRESAQKIAKEEVDDAVKYLEKTHSESYELLLKKLDPDTLVRMKKYNIVLSKEVIEDKKVLKDSRILKNYVLSVEKNLEQAQAFAKKQGKELHFREIVLFKGEMDSLYTFESDYGARIFWNVDSGERAFRHELGHAMHYEVGGVHIDETIINNFNYYFNELGEDYLDEIFANRYAENVWGEEYREQMKRELNKITEKKLSKIKKKNIKRYHFLIYEAKHVGAKNLLKNI